MLFRKHVVKYIKGAPGIGAVYLPLVTCQTADEFIALFSQWEEVHLDSPLEAAQEIDELEAEACEVVGAC